MMDVDLCYYVVFGSGDSSDDVPFTATLSDEEAVAYKRSVMLRIPMDEYSDLTDACERIRQEAQAYGEGDFSEENKWWDDEDDEEDEGFSDGWYVGVRFPEAYSNRLEDEEAVATLKTLLEEGDLDEVRDYVSRCSASYWGKHTSLGTLADSIAADMGISLHRETED